MIFMAFAGALRRFDQATTDKDRALALNDMRDAAGSQKEWEIWTSRQRRFYSLRVAA